MKLIQQLLPEESFINKLPENLKYSDKWLFETHERTYLHAVNLYEGRNITFWPEHIFIEKWKIWRKELTNHYINSKQYVLKRNIKSLLRKTIHLKGKYIIVTDDWSWSYFHWTADALQRAFLLKDYFKEYKLLIPDQFQQYSYIMQSLQLMGAEVQFMPANTNLKIDELVFASPLGGSGLFRYNFLKSLAGFIRSHPMVAMIKSTTPERIYISRGKAGYRRILNEEPLIELLKAEGFTILYAELYDYLSQVKYFSNCKFLISLHGGGLTNELYVPPSASVLEIRHPKDHLNNCYYLLATALHLPYYYFLADTENDDTHSADVGINMEDFSRTLTNFLKVNIKSEFK